MLREAHPHATTMVETDPRSATSGVEQGIKDGPVRHGIAAVQHALSLAVGTGHRAAVQMVPPDYHGGLELTVGNHLVESQAKPCPVAQPHPTDAGRQSLPADLLPGHVEPMVKVRVVGQQLLDLGVGLVDVLRVAGEGNPAERPDPSTEERADVGRHESGEVEGALHPRVKSDLADIVAIVKDRDAHVVELQHRAHVNGDRRPGRLDHTLWVGLAQRRGLFQRPANGQVSVQRVVRRGLVGDRIRPHPAPDQLRQDLRGIAQEAHRARLAGLARRFNGGHCTVKIRLHFIDKTHFQATFDTSGVTFHRQHRGTRHSTSQRLRAAHTAQPTGENPLAAPVAAVVLFAAGHKGLVRALDDALRADVDPRTSRHLTVHHEPRPVQLVEMLPGGPVWDEIGVGDEHTGRVEVRLEDAHRLARLDQEGLVGPEPFEGLYDLVIAFPIPHGSPGPPVDHQLGGVFSDLGVEVVHQHAHGRLGEPGSAGQRRTGGGFDAAFGVESCWHSDLLWKATGYRLQVTSYSRSLPVGKRATFNLQLDLD